MDIKIFGYIDDLISAVKWCELTFSENCYSIDHPLHEWNQWSLEFRFLNPAHAVWFCLMHAGLTPSLGGGKPAPGAGL